MATAAVAVITLIMSHDSMETAARRVLHLTKAPKSE